MAKPKKAKKGELLVPHDVEEAIKTYKGKRKRLTKEQWQTLKDYFATIPDVKEFLAKNFDYDDNDYKRIKVVFSTRKWTLGAGPRVPQEKGPPPPRKVITRKMAAVEREFLEKMTEQNYKELLKIAKMVSKHVPLMSELGYYDPEADRVDVVGFVEQAIMFFADTGPKMQEIQQENIANKALLELVGPAWNKTLIRIRDIRFALDMILRANPELELKLLPLRAEVPSFEE